jgi:CheY-like chemotaxis protein
MSHIHFKILVVEDNADSRELLHFLLLSKGFNVSTAVDGVEGLYMAKVEKPDLIITDLTMPNMDGIDLSKNIRSEPEISAVPIFVYTSSGSESTEPAIRAGVNKVFYKPVDIEKMIDFIIRESRREETS